LPKVATAFFILRDIRGVLILKWGHNPGHQKQALSGLLSAIGSRRHGLLLSHFPSPARIPIHRHTPVLSNQTVYSEIRKVEIGWCGATKHKTDKNKHERSLAMKVGRILRTVLLLAAFILPARASTFIVTNTNDSGVGSLRDGIAGPADSVRFDIPISDPGYDPLNQVWVIKPAIPYHVPKNKTIDGRIPLAGGGSRPGIEIDGSILGQAGQDGFRLEEGVVLRGLVVHSCAYGIWISVENCAVMDCYIGTDAGATVAKPNKYNGVLLINGAQNAVIAGNLISGNNYPGIRITGTETGHNTVIDNRIGCNFDGTAALANREGITIQNGASHNLIEHNLISGNLEMGVHLLDAGTNNNVIRHNWIGTDTSGTAVLANGKFGIALFNGPCNNTIGPGNVIAYHSHYGVMVDGSDDSDGTVCNIITANSIYANVIRGIENMRGGNGEPPVPSVQAVAADRIDGTSGAGQLVELFADQAGQGQIYLGMAEADVSGHFSLALTSTLLLPFVTATARDKCGNTSEFSAAMATEVHEPANTETQPQQYRLEQNYPNPFNSATLIRFALPSRSMVRLSVFDLNGRLLAVLVDEEMPAGEHTVAFDAWCLGSGVYFYRLQSGDFAAVHKLLVIN
jgi:hypothetical protein